MKSLSIVVVLASVLGAQAVAHAGPESTETPQQAIDRIVRQSAEKSGPDNGPVRELSRGYSQSDEETPARTLRVAASKEC